MMSIKSFVKERSMRPVLSLFLSLILFIQTSAVISSEQRFQISCDSTLVELDIVHAKMEELYKKNGNPYEDFKNIAIAQSQLDQIKKKADLQIEQLVNLVNQSKYPYFSSTSTSTDPLEGMNEEHLSPVEKSCSPKNFDKQQCDTFARKYISDPKFARKIDMSVQKSLQEHSQKIIEIQNQTHFKSLKTYEQFLAHNLLNSKNCLKQEGQRQQVLKIACGRNFDEFPDTSLGSHVQNNMEIILKLNQNLTKPDLKTTAQTCKKLNQIDKEYKTNFQFCQVVLQNYEHMLEEQKSGSDQRSDKKLDQKSYKEYAGHWSIKKQSKKSKKSAQTNAGKFWKTAGTVAAAVGVSGLIGWGLSALFSSTSQSSYTPPVAPTYDRNFYNYSMNPYQMYQYQMYQMNNWYEPGYNQNNYMNYFYNYDPNMTLNNYDTWGNYGGVNSSTTSTTPSGYSFSFEQ